MLSEVTRMDTEQNLSIEVLHLLSVNIRFIRKAVSVRLKASHITSSTHVILLAQCPFTRTFQFSEIPSNKATLDRLENTYKGIKFYCCPSNTSFFKH